MSDKRPTNWRPRRQPSDPARLVAFDALMEAEVNGAYLNLALPKEIRAAHLGKRDAAYATNLCYGTSRLSGRYDAIINALAVRRDVEPPVRVLLRMGCHQLLDMETPAHAAIHETVNITRNELGAGSSSFVNAILRKVSNRTLAQWRTEIAREHAGGATSLSFLAQWYSHPAWIVRSLAESLAANGRPAEDLAAVLDANNAIPDVVLVARNITSKQLARDIDAAHFSSLNGRLMPQARIMRHGDPGRLEAVRSFDAGVQDEGSQLIAHLTAMAPIKGRDELWIDMCAGPGGKTATLAAIAANKGAKIFANEVHEHRMQLVVDAVAPWKDIVAVRQGDGRDIGSEEPEHYDRILVDAPCSGLGSLRRRPEARWRKSPDDIPQLVELQGELLESAWKALRPGGLLVYSTCTPHVAETHGVMQTFLDGHDDATVLECARYATSVTRFPLESSTPYLQLWPDQYGTDAMFIALVVKNGGEVAAEPADAASEVPAASEAPAVSEVPATSEAPAAADTPEE